eukprot:m.155661 g.155661  ORF g.155661 m.155661 type:complete len:53 (+) comp16282_c0_seq4:996-1154(+)
MSIVMYRVMASIAYATAQPGYQLNGVAAFGIAIGEFFVTFGGKYPLLLKQTL